MEFIDSHAHLNDVAFDDDREDIILNLKKEGITKLILAGYSFDSSKMVVELSKKYNFIYPTCGISPNDIPQTEEELWKEIKQIENFVEKNHKIIAIGEIGLDYHWNKENALLQKLAFELQIKIANKFSKPIVIHTREAIMDTLNILKENKVEKKGVFHCCPLNTELVKEALKLDYYISFAGPVTFKNSKNADEVIKLVPFDRILIETDSPYLSPEPFRGKRNDPRNVKIVAQKVANVKQVSLEEVAKITYKNAMKLFDIS